MSTITDRERSELLTAAKETLLEELAKKIVEKAEAGHNCWLGVHSAREWDELFQDERLEKVRDKVSVEVDEMLNR